MFGIGTPELLVILAVALIVIGPKKLPDLAKSLGRALGEFKRATNDLKQSIEQETGLDEVRKDFTGVKQDVLSSMDPASKTDAKIYPAATAHSALPSAMESEPADDDASPDADDQEDQGPEDPAPEPKSDQDSGDDDHGKTTA